MKQEPHTREGMKPRPSERGEFTAFQQALAIVERSGEDVDRFLRFAAKAPESQPDFMRFFAGFADQGGWEDLAGLKMMHAGAQHVVEAAEDVGVDAALTRTVQDFYRRALDASTEERPVKVLQLLRGDAPAAQG